MSKAKIYSHTKYDITANKVIVGLRKGTRTSAESAGAEIIECTEEEVDTALLDDNGMLRD